MAVTLTSIKELFDELFAEMFKKARSNNQDDNNCNS